MADMNGVINDGSLTGTIYAGGTGGASITYTIRKQGSDIILEGSDGTQTKAEDSNTTYILKKNDDGQLVLEGSDKSESAVDMPAGSMTFCYKGGSD